METNAFEWQMLPFRNENFVRFVSMFITIPRCFEVS